MQASWYYIHHIDSKHDTHCTTLRRSCFLICEQVLAPKPWSVEEKRESKMTSRRRISSHFESHVYRNRGWTWNRSWIWQVPFITVTSKYAVFYLQNHLIIKRLPIETWGEQHSTLLGYGFHGCLPQARNRNTEGSNSAFNRKVKIQDGRQRVKKGRREKKFYLFWKAFLYQEVIWHGIFTKVIPIYHIIHISKILSSTYIPIWKTFTFLEGIFWMISRHFATRGQMWDSCCGTLRAIVYQNILNDMHWNPVLLF